MTASTDSARRRARELAFRVAYQADVMGEPVGEAWARARDAEPLSEDQRELVDDVLRALASRAGEIDAALREAARRRTRAAEQLGEAIEIAKRFGSEESGRFVNGVLDRVARTLRPDEL